MRHIAIGVLLAISFNAMAQDEERAPISPKYQQEISTLARQKVVQSAFDIIQQQDEQTIKDLIELTEIPAPPFKEEVRAQRFLEMLNAQGADSVWIDEEGNALGLRKGTKSSKTVVLDAHLDTVFPEGTDTNVRIKGDTLKAPGVGDDTRGLAMVVAVLRAMESANLETENDVLFIGTVGEEGLGDLRGVKFLFSEKGPKIDSWISIDGGDLGRVNNKGLGSYRYRVTFKGPGGHSWGSFGLVNPQHALGSAIHYFVDAADEYTSDGPKTSYNVGRIGGGTSINSVPFGAWMEIDIRSINPTRLDVMDSILRASVDRALADQNDIRRRGRPLLADIEKIGDRPSGELPSDLPLIQRAMATTEYFGVEPRLTRGSTNSNTPIAKGIPAVTIGRGGRSKGAHSLTEWWSNQEGYKATQLAMLLLVVEAGLGN